MADVKLCECGCGRPTKLAKRSERGHLKGQANRFLQGHRIYIAKPAIRAYRRKSRDGLARPLHVLIAEHALGKPMPRQAIVHHIDENKLNNSPSNLAICQDRAYHLLIHKRMRILAAGGNPNTEKICCRCHKPKRLDCFAKAHSQHDGLQSICRSCQSVYQKQHNAKMNN